MEDLPLGRIAALMPEFSVKDLPLGRTCDDDDTGHKPCCMSHNRPMPYNELSTVAVLLEGPVV